MAGRYATVVDFGSDLHLIWSNAHLFNLDGSDIYVAATHMATECEQRMRSIPDGTLRDGGGGSGSGGGSAKTNDDAAGGLLRRSSTSRGSTRSTSRCWRAW